jgi:hypothetical protein
VVTPHEDFNPNAGEWRLPPPRGLYQAPPPIQVSWGALYAAMALRLAERGPAQNIEAAACYMAARYAHVTSWTAWLSYRARPRKGPEDDQP